MSNMHYSDYKKYDVLNGNGIRHSLFVSGCTHHCKGCFNKKIWDFKYGKPFNFNMEQQVLKDLRNKNVAGLSILGGEPFDNVQGLLSFVKRVNQHCAGENKDIWVWSGYTFEQIKKDPEKLELLKLINVLVDGRFIKELKDLTLKFRGSSNQRIIDVQKSLKENKVVLYNI